MDIVRIVCTLIKISVTQTAQPNGLAILLRLVIVKITRVVHVTVGRVKSIQVVGLVHRVIQIVQTKIPLIQRAHQVFVATCMNLKVLIVH